MSDEGVALTLTSSVSSSSSDVGIVRTPPKVVRCVVAQSARFLPVSSVKRLVVMPSVFHACTSVSQYLQSIRIEQLASTYSDGQTHLPLTH